MRVGLLAAGEDADLLVDRITGEKEGAEQLAARSGHHRCGVVELGEDGVGRVERLDLVLCEVRDLHARSQFDLACVRLQDAGQHLQKRRLAGTVRTDKRHLLAALQGEVEVAA